MDSSSDSNTHDGSSGHRSRVRERRLRHGNRFPRDAHVSDISGKIDTLANTLHDTSRNLNKVDRMLGQYKEHADDQAEAMATLRKSLEESIQHLQGQRPRTVTSGWSASLSTLQTSDLEDDSTSDWRRYLPMSHRRNNGSVDMGKRRRSSSVAVRFRDSTQTEKQVHSLHQSLRDLQNDQLQMGDDINREISRRNRSDKETKKMLGDLAGHIKESHKEESALRIQTLEADETFRNRLQRSDNERNKMQQELERLRKQLDQSERGRDTHIQQMDDMRSQLLRIEKEHVDLQRELSLLLSQQRSSWKTQERGVTGFDNGCTVLERETEDLRVRLGRICVSSEVEEMKKGIEQKEREKTQLTCQVEALSADLKQREQLQLKMFSQLKEVQSHLEDSGLDCARLEAQLVESERRRKDLHFKAQEAVRQWKTKCKKLQQEFHKLEEESRNSTDKDERSKEREGVLRQQAESARRQLTDALGHLAQREEDLHRCELDLAEARSQLVTLELELREARESMRGLEEEAQTQITLQIRIKEENIMLHERMKLQEQQREEEKLYLLDLQDSIKNLKAVRADLTARQTEVECANQSLEKQLTAAQEESSSLKKQLELARQVHQKELSYLQMSQQEGKAKQERDVHDMLRLYQQERDELEAFVRNLKLEAVADSELRKALQLKLDKMKSECDNLTKQLSSSKERHNQLLRKYRTLRKELDMKVKQEEREEERKQTAENSITELHKRVSGLQSEQESIFNALGARIDSACQFLSKDSAAKLEAITLTPGLPKDSHRWLAEVKTKLEWLCEELQERQSRESRLRRTLHQHKEQIKALKQSRDSESQKLLDCITLQERLRKDDQSEKRGRLEKVYKKEDEMRNLQGRIVDLETSSRLALDHLESVPEKLSLLENFKNLEESQRQKEMVEQCYAKHKEIAGGLRHQLEETKRKILEYRDEKSNATCRSLQLTALTSLLSQKNSLTSTHTSPQTPLASPDLESRLNAGHYS